MNFSEACCVDDQVADHVELSRDLDRYIDRGLYLCVIQWSIHVEYLWEFLDAVSIGGDVDGVGLRTRARVLLLSKSFVDQYILKILKCIHGHREVARLLLIDDYKSPTPVLGG